MGADQARIRWTLAWLIGASSLLAVGLLLLFWLGGDSSWVAPDGPEAVVEPTAPDPEPAAPAAPSARRVPIPRPAAAPAAAEHTDPPFEHTDEAALVDSDFPRVQAQGAQIRAAIDGALAPHMQGMIGCLQGWSAEQPEAFVGRAVFVFQFDEQGIVEMAVEDVDTVPEGVLACLGDLLWEDVEWPGIAGDEPGQTTEVSWPVQLSVDE